MREYKNLNAAVNDYRERGYDLNFDLRTDALGCEQLRSVMETHEFDVEEELAFPDEKAYLYPVSTIYNAKGLLQLDSPVAMADLKPAMQVKFGSALA